MSNFDKYISVVNRLRKRYSKGGIIHISKGGVPCKYALLEDMAAVKYLGAHPRYRREIL